MFVAADFVRNQLFLAVPIGIVILLFVLLFAYSIRPAQQPKFKLDDADERKTAGKKKKLKEKKSVNGHVSTGVSKADKSPVKEKKAPEQIGKKEKADNNVKNAKKSETVKDVKKVESTKKVNTESSKKSPSEFGKKDSGKKTGTVTLEPKKKVNKKVVQKPVDFDDGEWEMVPSKADKKKKPDQSPPKKEKKAKKRPSPTPTEESPSKTAETSSEPEPEPVPAPEPVKVEAPAPVVEEKKEMKKKTKKETKPVVEKVPDQPAKPAPAPAPAKTEKETPAPAGGAAFDELGDTWTEAKPAKKSKKKARREN